MGQLHFKKIGTGKKGGFHAKIHYKKLALVWYFTSEWKEFTHKKHQNISLSTHRAEISSARQRNDHSHWWEGRPFAQPFPAAHGAGPPIECLVAWGKNGSVTENMGSDTMKRGVAGKHIKKKLTPQIARLPRPHIKRVNFSATPAH